MVVRLAPLASRKCVRPMERLYHKFDGSIGQDKRAMKLYKDGVDCDECKRCKIDTDFENP